MTCHSSARTVSLRLSVTELCQLACMYCRPASGCVAQKRGNIGDTLSFQHIARFVKLIRRHFCLSKVHLTGGEPLLRPNLAELIRLLADEGLDLALTTNGQCLEKHALALKRAGLRRVNVSLDSLNPTCFAHMTGGAKVERTLAGIRKAIEVQLQPVKINMTVLRGVNDQEVEAVAQYGLDLGCEVRFLELMPIGPAKDQFDNLFVSALDIRQRLERAFSLKRMEDKPGQSAQRYQAQSVQGQVGVLGLIAPYTHPFCQGCSRLRLTSAGQLITCLASGRSIDLSRWLQESGLRSDHMIKQIVDRELDAKCMRGSFDTNRPMVAVGG